MRDNFFRIFSILFPLAILSTSGKCVTDKKQEMDTFEEKLPIIINRGYKVIDGKNGQSLYGHEDANITNALPFSNLKNSEKKILEYKQDVNLSPVQEKTDIDYTKISRLVNTIKKKLCSVNKEGSYEVWLQIEGGASGVFVSASAQTGIKAIINCSSEGIRN